MPPEATVQATTKDFAFEIITDHVDSSVTDAQISPQGQTSALPRVSRFTQLALPETRMAKHLCFLQATNLQQSRKAEKCLSLTRAIIQSH